MPQQLVVPGERVDVEQQRAAGVADVGHVAASAGQPPDEERVDGAERDLARLRARPQARARCRAGASPSCPRSTRRARGRSSGGRGPRGPSARSASQIGRADPALPDDRVGDRAAGRALPEDHGLALVRDADGGDVGRRDAGASRGTSRATASCEGQIASGSCSTWPGCGKSCGNSCCADRDRAAVAAEHDRARGGRALVEREDVFHVRHCRAKVAIEWSPLNSS